MALFYYRYKLDNTRNELPVCYCYRLESIRNKFILFFQKIVHSWIRTIDPNPTMTVLDHYTRDALVKLDFLLYIYSRLLILYIFYNYYDVTSACIVLPLYQRCLGEVGLLILYIFWTFNFIYIL